MQQPRVTAPCVTVPCITELCVTELCVTVPCVTVPCVTVPCTWNERCTEFVYADYTVFATSELWKDTIFLKHKYVWNGVENDSTNTKEYHNVHKASYNCKIEVVWILHNADIFPTLNL